MLAVSYFHKIMIGMKNILLLSLFAFCTIAAYSVGGATDLTWNGAVSSDVSNSANWTQVSGIDAVVDYLIPSGTPNAPVLSGGGLFSLNSGSDTKMRINAGATFTVSSTSVLSLTNLVVSLNGMLTLESNEQGSANLIVKTQQINGTVNVQKFLESSYPHYFAGWKYLGNPFTASYTVATKSLDPAQGVVSDLFSWDEASTMWLNFVGGSFNGTMVPGRGYITRPLNGDKTVTFSSTGRATSSISLNIADVNVPLTHSGLGYNLVANPYVSGYLLNAQSNIQNAVYVWNNTMVNYEILTAGSGASVGALQGFFVYTDQPTANYVFSGANRVSNTGGLKAATMETNQLVMMVKSPNGCADKVSLLLNESANDAYELEYDAKKMFGPSESPQLYFAVGAEKLAVNAVSSPYNETKKYGVSLQAGTSGRFMLSVESLAINENVQVLLEDNRLHKTIDLREVSSYGFDVSSSDGNDRFTIVLKSVALGSSTVDQGDVRIYAKQKNIVVKGLNQSSQVYVYDLSGKLVTSAVLHGTYNDIETNLTKGIYLVKVSSVNGEYTQKVVLK